MQDKTPALGGGINKRKHKEKDLTDSKRLKSMKDISEAETSSVCEKTAHPCDLCDYMGRYCMAGKSWLFLYRAYTILIGQDLG